MSEEQVKYETGPLSVEMRLRSAIAALVAAFMPAGPGVSNDVIAGAAGLYRAEKTGGLAEMVRAVNAARALIGAPGELTEARRACWVMVLAAYDAALAAQEKEAGGGLWVVRHTVTGKGLLARYNAAAGLAHMTWVEARWALPMPQETAEKVAAAYVALSGDDYVRVEWKGSADSRETRTGVGVGVAG